MFFLDDVLNALEIGDGVIGFEVDVGGIDIAVDGNERIVVIERQRAGSSHFRDVGRDSLHFFIKIGVIDSLNGELAARVDFREIDLGVVGEPIDTDTGVNIGDILVGIGFGGGICMEIGLSIRLQIDIGVGLQAALEIDLGIVEDGQVVDGE